MKNLLFVLVAVFLASNIFAQAPNKMSYQTVIRNSSNALVTSQTVGVQITILQNSATGTSVYVERHTPVTNANGLASFEIGSGTVISGTFSTINWGTGTYFVKTQVDPTGGTSYTITGTSQLLSVPYALHSKTADALTGGGGSSPWTASGSNIYSSNTGNVGIGTTTPSEKLDIKGATNTTAVVKIDQVGTTQYMGARFDRASVEKWFLGMNNSDNDLIIRQGSSTDRVVIKENGNVGIGTTNPTNRLEVVDNASGVYTAIRNLSTSSTAHASIYFDRSAAGSVHTAAIGYTPTRKLFFNVNGVDYLTISDGSICHSGSFSACSDKRYKKDFAPISNALTSVLKMEGLFYNWRVDEFKHKGFTDERQIGFIAQDLELLYPELVVTGEDGYKSVDYTRLTPILVEAVKEQQAQIEALKAENEKIKVDAQAENASLRASIERIENQLGLGLQGKK